MAVSNEEQIKEAFERQDWHEIDDGGYREPFTCHRYQGYTMGYKFAETRIAALEKLNGELINGLKYCLDYGTFDSAIDNSLHAAAFDRAKQALRHANLKKGFLR